MVRMRFRSKEELLDVLVSDWQSRLIPGAFDSDDGLERLLPITHIIEILKTEPLLFRAFVVISFETPNYMPNLKPRYVDWWRRYEEHVHPFWTAVFKLLCREPGSAGPVPEECATPTGAAILATLVDEWSELPPMRMAETGYGPGQRDPEQAANVLRRSVGTPIRSESASAQHSRLKPVLFKTNVDDSDPRLWPWVLDRLLAAAAENAWLTPIVMKNGRPAHTLSVLCSASFSTRLPSW